MNQAGPSCPDPLRRTSGARRKIVSLLNHLGRKKNSSNEAGDLACQHASQDIRGVAAQVARCLQCGQGRPRCVAPLRLQQRPDAEAGQNARRDLRIAGAPVGEEITDLSPCIANSAPIPAGSRARRACTTPAARDDDADATEQGSIIVVVATDAPLLPHQLKRIATRVSLGIGRQGGFGGNSSGDIFVTFSTANANSWSADTTTSLRMLANDRLSPLFKATAQATEAAITNALLAAETMTGADDLRIFAMPVDRMLDIMRKYRRMP